MLDAGGALRRRSSSKASTRSGRRTFDAAHVRLLQDASISRLAVFLMLL